MPNKKIEKAVPAGRLSRFASLSALAGSLTANVAKNAFSAALQAERPTARNTLLHTNNAKSITHHLSKMRGAAMKLGQMLSMDAGELLPKEWEEILAVLREQANIMPKSQLLSTLNEHWGASWADKFDYFSFEPIAAASIGQVHKARLKSGELLAVKVQYPGVSRSIDSDLDNLAGLLKMTRLIPEGLDIDGLLEQAKEQLKQEADYRIEAKYLEDYAQFIGDDERYIVPKVFKEHSNSHILCMEFIDAQTISSLLQSRSSMQKREHIDLMVNHLFELTLRELFDFQFTQSDPNYANFLFKPETAQIVLLDFGACKRISDKARKGYQAMALSMLKQHRDGMNQSLLDLGLINSNTPKSAVEVILNGCMTASECLQTNVYNFKEQGLISKIQAQTQGLIREKKAIASPDFDVALINRKVSGVVLLANKLNANVSLRELVLKFANDNSSKAAR